jgi:hypothetical protein
MKKILFLLSLLLTTAIASAKFVYDPVTNTFSYVNDTPVAVSQTGTASTGTTVATGVVSTGTITTGTASGSDISGLLKTLDTNTLLTLNAFKAAYDIEYAKLANAATDATAKGLMGMVMCFTTNPKSPDQLK